MISTEINSKDPIIDIDQQEQQLVNKENKSPNEFIEVDVQKLQEQSNLQMFCEQQLDNQQLIQKELERQQRIKKLQITLKRQLSTINELSDQSINYSCSPQIDVDHQQPKKKNKDYLFQIQEENKQTETIQVDLQKQQKKKTKKKKKKKHVSHHLAQSSISIPEIKY